MNRDVPLKKYQKKMEYSYTLGAFPTVELLKNQPGQALKVLLHSNLTSVSERELVTRLCAENQIPIENGDKAIARISDKENCMVAGVFKKYAACLNEKANHIVLVNPSDMGNAGTIIRTCLGFGVTEIAIVGLGVDVFHPKVARASMGALFQVHIQYFQDFGAYYNIYHNEKRSFYPFMLKGATDLSRLERAQDGLFSLIFGNEASGLDDAYLEVGKSVFIRHSDKIDSLNLSMAVGIALFEFTR
ncbi:TrmH family RNA methyltransferase [Hydrogeniiclostridium mannosilyticum]|uniref:TrmH family RNA methyltransferase n=1 Tax=Hydrogeniiclostridium mannosilyticum TaxID=2764322 RepID=UPI0018AA5972|nr:TrmH family RNA methyltransferase [Hydrogeniiclostridium mannosilyticum]